MSLLEELIYTYEINELPLEEVLFTVSESIPEYRSLSKEDQLTLKREFINHVDRAEYRLEDTANVYENRHLHKKYVEAFISNITVPRILEELYDSYLAGNDAQLLIKDIHKVGQQTGLSLVGRSMVILYSLCIPKLRIPR